MDTAILWHSFLDSHADLGHLRNFKRRAFQKVVGKEEMISAQQLVAGLHCQPRNAIAYVKYLNDAMDKYGINTNARIAVFLAQVAVESCNLSEVMEDLDYSAEELVKEFHAHFDEALAEKYAHNPIAIANRAYANRYGNGDEASGDGWKYRGRGLIQITFRENYAACGKALGIDLVDSPNFLISPRYAAESAAWYFVSHGCNELADAGKFDEVTGKINGGQNGAKLRHTKWEDMKKILLN